MSRIRKIGGACLNQTPLEWEGNLQNILAAIETARAEQVDLLCLPELCITGYGCEDLFLSEWLPQKALEQLGKIIPYTEGIAVIVGLPFRLEHQTYNTIAIIEDRELKGFYAKHNLANEGVHYEPRWFASWPFNRQTTVKVLDQEVPFGFLQLQLKNIDTGFEICEDAWQQDRPADHFEQPVELILNPSASHFAFGKEEIRENLVVSSSKKYHCTYVYSNLLGNEAGRMIYDGDILIGHYGNLVGHNRRLSFLPFNLLSLEVDFDQQKSELNVRDDWNDKFEEFGQAVPLALFDYMRKSHTKGFVLSLSGGADSSTIAVMVARMVQIGIKELGLSQFLSTLHLNPELKPEEVVREILTTAYQGTTNSSDQTRASAKALAESLGAKYFEWLIDEEIEQYTRTIEARLGRNLTWEKDDSALQNIQARARSPIIWMLANIEGKLLLTTSNRSEGSVGYTTMDGDTSGSIAPIAAVDKFFIRNWLKYAEDQLGHLGLNKVNALQPSAELRPLKQVQTDEDDLMPYEVLVEIERLGIKEKRSPLETYHALASRHDPKKLKDWIRKFYRLWAINQWKRERIAPSFHLDDYNVDPRTWCRFPILSGGFKEDLKKLEDLQ
jgi:NAD+ synthase (glutamine-hydrolysing)